MAYTPAERETYYNFDDSSDICYIYTCNKTLQKKLDGFCKKHPDIYKLTAQDECSKSYTTKKKYVSVRAPRTLSEDHKAKLKLNGKQTNNK